MSDNRDNRFWNAMAGEMQRSLHLHPLTDNEAAREYDEAADVPFSEDELEQYVAIARSQIPREPSYAERTGSSLSNEQIDQEMGEFLALHRNEGELDPEVEEEMRRKRLEALEDDEEEDANGESTGEP